MTIVRISIETEDMDLAERLGRTLNGNLTGAIEAQQAPDPEPQPEQVSQFQRDSADASESAGSAEPAPDVRSGNGSAGTTNAPHGVELDKAGLPWDERIHSGSKALKADGYWKAKRGVNPELVKQVEAELRAAMDASVPTPEPQPEPEQGGYVAPPSPEPQPEPQASKPDAPTTFMELVGLIGQKGITQDQLTEACTKVGIPQFGNLNARPDLIGPFWDALGV